WGNLTGSTGSATTPFGFAGAYLDPSNGLYYLRARWYDAGTGQFMSENVNPIWPHRAHRSWPHLIRCFAANPPPGAAA
ncbi:MAG: RHS repeat-associated core domain-containing protein, partial [Acidimicrobiales bacterium]